MIVGTLPDVFDTLVCGSKITRMYGRTPCSQSQSHRRACQQLDRTADLWFGKHSCQCCYSSSSLEYVLEAGSVHTRLHRRRARMAHSLTGAHSRCRSFRGHAEVGGTVPSSRSSLTALTYLCVPIS